MDSISSFEPTVMRGTTSSPQSQVTLFVSRLYATAHADDIDPPIWEKNLIDKIDFSLLGKSAADGALFYFVSARGTEFPREKDDLKMDFVPAFLRETLLEIALCLLNRFSR